MSSNASVSFNATGGTGGSQSSSNLGNGDVGGGAIAQAIGVAVQQATVSAFATGGNGGAGYSGERFSFDYLATGGVSATPLPSTWTMMLIGLAGFGFVAYRRQRKEAAFADAC